MLKRELQKTLSAPECRAAEQGQSFRWSAGGQGFPPRPAALSGRAAGPARGVRCGRARPPTAGPFLARLPSARPLPAAVPATSPPPSRTPATFPGLASPLSSTQKLQARRLLSTAPIFPPTARARGPHRRPAARGRAGEEPGRPPQRRVCTLMLSAAGRRKKRAHVRALARRSGPGSRDASACPHAAASSRGAPRPPRGASFSLFLSQRRRDPPRGRRRLPARPTSSSARRGQTPGATAAARADSPRSPREVGLASPARLRGKGLPEAHSDGILSPGGGGREATSADTGAGVVGTTFCVPARRRPRRSLCARPRSQVELRAPGCPGPRKIKVQVRLTLARSRGRG